MIKALGNVLVVLTCVGSVVFCVMYALFSPWWKTAMGRNIMAMMATIGLFLILAIIKMIYSGRARTTMFGVLQFFYGLLPGQHVPRFDIPEDRNHTLPYAVPICFGSLLSFLLFHA